VKSSQYGRMPRWCTTQVCGAAIAGSGGTRKKGERRVSDFQRSARKEISPIHRSWVRVTGGALVMSVSACNVGEM